MSIRRLASGSWGPALRDTNEIHHDQTRERKSEDGHTVKVRGDTFPRLCWLPI